MHQFIHDSYTDQKKKLAMEMDPNLIDFPIGTIRGPVSWKCNFQLATNRLDQVIYQSHQNQFFSLYYK